MFKRRLNKHLKIDTLIDVGTRIEGDLEFSGGMHLDGYINGSVRGQAGDTGDSILWVGERGGIEGSVTVFNLVLNGIVKGDIDAGGRVELGENARVLGNVRYSVLETAVGAQINGRLIHRSPPAVGALPDSAEAVGRPADA